MVRGTPRTVRLSRYNKSSREHISANTKDAAVFREANAPHRKRIRANALCAGLSFWRFSSTGHCLRRGRRETLSVRHGSAEWKVGGSDGWCQGEWASAGRSGNATTTGKKMDRSVSTHVRSPTCQRSAVEWRDVGEALQRSRACCADRTGKM